MFLSGDQLQGAPVTPFCSFCSFCLQTSTEQQTRMQDLQEKLSKVQFFNCIIYLSFFSPPNVRRLTTFCTQLKCLTSSMLHPSL